MKRVTLYTIQEEQRVVFDRDEYVKTFQYHPDMRLVPVVAGATPADELIVTEIHTPIRRVIKRGETLYVAIQKELEEILMAPKTAEYQEEIRKLVFGMDKLEARISAYNTLPWWKKIFTGKI